MFNDGKAMDMAWSSAFRIATAMHDEHCRRSRSGNDDEVVTIPWCPQESKDVHFNLNNDAPMEKQVMRPVIKRKAIQYPPQIPLQPLTNTSIKRKPAPTRREEYYNALLELEKFRTSIYDHNKPEDQKKLKDMQDKCDELNNTSPVRDTRNNDRRRDIHRDRKRKAEEATAKAVEHIANTPKLDLQKDQDFLDLKSDAITANALVRSNNIGMFLLDTAVVAKGLKIERGKSDSDPGARATTTLFKKCMAENDMNFWEKLKISRASSTKLFY